ncbi:MAG TPA: hypothetical protein PLZ36_09675, partial [Armatimonadota bacterium]|nr:hypothetical protein [Armatimonadota bacterium]
MRKQLIIAVLCTALAGAASAETVPVFTGNNSYVNIGTPDALQIPSSAPFTIEGWMVFDALSTRDMLYCKNNGRSGPPYTYMFGFADHKLSAYNSAWRGNFAVAREIGRWYHVAFSFDGSTLSFYLDGALLGSIAFSFNNNAAHTVKLGGYDASSDTKGRKSDVRVWDHARTQAQIQAAMRERLTGEEDGLLACWPLADGAGAAVADRSPNGCDGALVNASWAADDTLTLLDFILANPVTGSGRFTNTNRLGVVRMPSVDGYADCQITQGGAPPSAGAWLSTDAPPATVVLDVPGSADAEVTVTAWLTNTSAAVALQRIDRKVAFTAVAPVPLIAATAARQLLPGCGALFYPEDLDGGSGGGEVFSSAIPVHRLQLQWVGGPAANASPDEPWVTLHTLGDYELELVVCNAAGNVATSSVCAATVEPWSGEPFIWTGAVGAEWSERLNWNHAVVPPAGAAVFLEGGAAVTLADSTAALGSLVISNATLTFVNWETVLAAADVHAGPGAAITHAGPVKDGMMSNRVHIVCSNFTLAAGATIAVDDKGYAGTRNGTAGFYGNGPGRPTRERGAASHGGMGGGSGSGPAYGDPAQPLHPGSGGDGQYGATGGHGGGAVRIAASGHVVINGSILASSSDVASNSGGGSGGSIYITADTIAATNGQLRADGASTTQMGGGGGGRIAINIADHVTQAQLPRVVYGLSARRGDRTTINGEHGTVWLNDRNLMPTIMNNCNGYFLGIDDWDWRVPVMAMTNSWLIIDQDMSLAVDGDMRLFNTTMDTTTLALDINGDLDVCGASSVYVRSGPTNGVAPWGATVNVAGTLSMGAGSTIYTASNPTNGGSVCYTLGNLVMASGSSINADGLGFSGGPVQGYGPGCGIGTYGGGGYGGAGGRSPYGGFTYGLSTEPLYPGSGGAGRNGKSGTAGGGLVYLMVAGSATIDGSITANGVSAGNEQGCGSGGGIFLDADTLATAFGAICADGGDNSSSYGAGGGGRIALRYRIDNFDGTLTARGGTGAYPGGEGSIVRELDASYVSLILAGYPVRHGTCQPYDYGLNGVIAGSVVTNTVNSPADEAGGEHFVCLGWSATNGLGEAFSGGGTQAVLTVASPTWLTWHWTNQYYLAVSAGQGGGLAVARAGWYTNGVPVSVTAVADPGSRFLQWVGPGLTPEAFLDNPLTVLMDRTREVQAVFADDAAPTARASAQSGAWFAPETWAPAGIPGEGDSLAV